MTQAGDPARVEQWMREVSNRLNRLPVGPRWSRVDIGALPNATLKVIAHGIVGLGTVHRISGVGFRASDGMYVAIPNGA